MGERKVIEPTAGLRLAVIIAASDLDQALGQLATRELSMPN